MTYDIADRLPERARAKLVEFRQELSDLRTTMHPVADDLQAERAKKIQCDRNIRLLTDGLNGRPAPADDPNLLVIKRDALKAEQEIRRLNELSEKRREIIAVLGELVSQAEQFVEGLPRSVPIELYRGPAPELRKGEKGVLDAIERCRRRDRELRADKQAAMEAPIESIAAKELFRAEVERMAEKGRPDFCSVVDHGGGVIWPKEQLFTGQVGAPLVLHDTLPILAWLFRDQLIAAGNTAIELVSDDGRALDDVARAARLAEIANDALAIEREEEFWINQARESGVQILRRADADPRALLEIETPIMGD